MKELENIKGTSVSRSVYQKLSEENKRLKADLKVLCFGGFSDDAVIRRKWKDHFQKEKDFNSMMKEFATEYLKSHPELDITKKTELK